MSTLSSDTTSYGYAATSSEMDEAAISQYVPAGPMKELPPAPPDPWNAPSKWPPPLPFNPPPPSPPPGNPPPVTWAQGAAGNQVTAGNWDNKWIPHFSPNNNLPGGDFMGASYQKSLSFQTISN